MNLENLVRPNIWKLKPYSSARHEFDGRADVFLDANENPYGGAFSRYPDPLQRAVKQEIAKIKNVPPECIFLGNGSDEAIDLVVRIFCDPRKDKILIQPPTYGMYKVGADVADVGIQEVLLKDDFSIDMSSLKSSVDQTVKVLFLCSPNNPTGNLLPRQQIREILEWFGGIVVLDEAYIDFANDPGWISQLDDYPNLIVLQTFSKAWGLAGIRLGLAFAAPEVIALFNKVKPPYNVNSLTQEKVLTAMQNQREVMIQHVSEIRLEREKLAVALKLNPLVVRVYPSQANFLLIQFERPREVFNTLKARGVIIRDRTQTPLCEDCLRITVGNPKENQLVLNVLNQMR